MKPVPFNILPGQQIPAKRDQQYREKIFKGWQFRDTFSNWNTRQQPHPDSSSLSSLSHKQISSSLNKNGKTHGSPSLARITLSDYFKAGSQLGNCEEEYHHAREDLLAHIGPNFLIHETDEDCLTESSASIRVSQKEPNEQKMTPIRTLRSLKALEQAKTKTERSQEGQTSVQKNDFVLTKEKPTSFSSSKEKLQRIHSSSRTKEGLYVSSPNHHHLFCDSSKETRRELMSKAKINRGRASELQHRDAQIFMKYAAKFKLDDSSCKQILRSCKI